MTLQITQALIDTAPPNVLLPAAQEPDALNDAFSPHDEIPEHTDQPIHEAQQQSDSTLEDTDEPPPSDRRGLLADVDRRVAADMEAIPHHVREEALSRLRNPNLMASITADIANMGLIGEETLGKTVYLIGTSRLLDKPVSGIVQGSSSSGKSHVIDVVGKLFPDCARLIATDITANAFYYMAADALVHCWVIAGERSRRTNDDRAEHTRALREMISAGCLRKVVTMGCSTEEINREGPIAFIESTTLEDSQIFEEDLNRCFLLHTDETADQSRRVMEGIARAAASSTDHNEVQEQIRLTHYAMQLSLKRVRAIIPFAPRIASCMPTGFPASRRAFTLFLGLVQAVALLHQYQRVEVPEHGTQIEATLDDYAMARELALAPLGSLLTDDLNARQRQVADALWSAFSSITFTTTQAADIEGITASSQNRLATDLKTLAELRVVECVQTGSGRRPAQWRLPSRPLGPAATFLPTADDLRAADATAVQTATADTEQG